MRRVICVVLLAVVFIRTGAAQPPPPFLIEASLDVDFAYPGQAVLYTVYAYSDTARDVTFEMPTFEGFWQADFRTVHSRQSVFNKQYDVVQFQVRLYPQRVGKMNIDTARADFAETVFSAGESLVSNAVTLDVLPLPPEPDGFSGLVGAVSAQFSAQPAVARIGEPVDIVLRLHGSANLVQFIPQLNMMEGWRIYAEPALSETEFDGSILTQTRVLRWRGVPDRAGRFTLSVQPIIYFKLTDGYQTLQVLPADLEILPGENGELSRETLVNNVHARLQTAPPQSAPDAAPVAVWFIAPTAVFGVFMAREAYRRWQIMQAEARKRNALRRAENRLQAALRSGGILAIEAAVAGYFQDYGREIAGNSEAATLLMLLESERYHPDGERQIGTLAHRALDMLRRIEGADEV